MSEWKPIDENTPPRECVLVYLPWINAVRMAQFKSWGDRPPRWFVWFGPSKNQGMYVSARPTHWMPLPAPPDL